MALVKAALTRKVSDPFTLATLTLHNFNFVLFEFSATRLAMFNTFVLGLATATLGTGLALVIAYLANRQAIKGASILGLLATAPVAVPGIVLGVGLFLAYSRPPFLLYGTLWILLLAFLTIELPAGYQQMQAAFRGVHADLEEASRMLGATRLQTLSRINAPLLQDQRGRDVVLRVHRHHPRAVRNDPADDGGNQARLRHHLRPARIRRPRRHLGARACCCWR